MKLENYPDSKCRYGYMTICTNCLDKAPHWVNTKESIKDFFPKVQCEICGRRPKPSQPPKQVVHNKCFKCHTKPKAVNMEICLDCWADYVSWWQRENPQHQFIRTQGPKDRHWRLKPIQR